VRLIFCGPILLGASIGLASCGFYVPAIEAGRVPSQETVERTASFVNAVAAHVNCELGKAVNQTAADLGADWLYAWSAKTTLTLTVDEKSSLSPGLAISRDVFTLGVGSSLNGDATRIQTISWFFDFADFFADRNDPTPCERQGSYPIAGDLQILESVYSGAKTAEIKNTVSQPFQKGGPLDVIEHHVTFDLSVSGNLTPTWKFVNVSANADGTFLSATRDRKDDLVITMGPSELEATNRRLVSRKVIGPSKSVSDAHLAAQIGQAVSTALRSSR
jgi:hypothetical protein